MTLSSARSPARHGGHKASKSEKAERSMNNPIRTAVIGTGFMGRVHLEALRRVEHVDVIAVVGRQLGPAEKLAEGYGVPEAFDSYEALLKNPELDAVHVCTPNASHYP